jgi:murein DD-endopeptidase MepM/ murein hydrolase activator NlpD
VLVVVGLAATVLTSLATPVAVPPPLPPAPPVARPPESVPTEVVLGRRDTLERALVRGGLPRPEAAALIAALRASTDPRRVRPGERLLLAGSADGAVAAVTWWRSPVERYEIRRRDAAWAVEAVRTPVETRVAAVAGGLADSLFASIERLGETAALTARLVELFEWDFDFAAHALPGDRFRLLVEKRHAEGHFLGYGDILVAEYRSVGRAPLVAVHFPDEDGRPRYYDTSGRSVRKMFLRAPLDFTRITSGFSHARRHPVLGGLRPHLAVDYGAPTGTPVRAVADGVVVSAGWNGGYGITVMIRHARGYRTMYNHLSAALVRPGQRVSQRQVIGRVGSTGLSTGPHLDYRVEKNGVFVNPLGEKFIPGAPVPAERRQAFAAHLAEHLRRLEREAPLPPAL